jgi:hypothetical protein
MPEPTLEDEVPADAGVADRSRVTDVAAPDDPEDVEDRVVGVEEVRPPGASALGAQD